jgi:hypothetical protein
MSSRCRMTPVANRLDSPSPQSNRLHHTKLASGRTSCRSNPAARRTLPASEWPTRMVWIALRSVSMNLGRRPDSGATPGSLSSTSSADPGPARVHHPPELLGMRGTNVHAISAVSACAELLESGPESDGAPDTGARTCEGLCGGRRRSPSGIDVASSVMRQPIALMQVLLRHCLVPASSGSHLEAGPVPCPSTGAFPGCACDGVRSAANSMLVPGGGSKGPGSGSTSSTSVYVSRRPSSRSRTLRRSSTRATATSVRRYCSSFGMQSSRRRWTHRRNRSRR